jgi:hypothetical protein
MDIKSKLPASFGVKSNSSHPRWSECLNIMNEAFNGDFDGDHWEYYGYDTYDCYECWDDSDYFDNILSIDEFFQMIEGSHKISNYQIF